MFIRKKKNKSGSYSFHIVRKVGRKQMLVKAIGFATDSAGIKKLELSALQELSAITKQSELNFIYNQDEQYLSALRENIQSIRIIGPELILGKLFDEVGFNQIKEKLFRHLVLSRICYPGSKLKTVEYLLRHHQEFYDIDAVYRYLDKLNTKHKEQLQSISYKHTLKIVGGMMSVVFYDVTTLYFEASEEDDLRKIGFNKDGKNQHPQIVLGLLVSAGGYPLAFEMFEGNKFEGQTILPVIEKFKEDARWDGLKGYLTNTALSAGEVIENYKHLWQIEKAFRISKTDLKIRPIYHRLKHRIETHLIIAFCSYKIYKELERQLHLKQTGISSEKAIAIMQSIFAVKTILPVSAKTIEIIMAKTEEQQSLLRYFEIMF